MNLRPFHLAMPVTDLEKTREFYEGIMGLKHGRFSKRSIDYDFFGHQVVFHKVDDAIKSPVNPVDGKHVPVPHFGIVLERTKWDELAVLFKKAGVKFIIEPYLRFEGQTGEQGTFFIEDPNGLNLEFKTMSDLDQLFSF
jgi:extradiol dioxygenase family protein